MPVAFERRGAGIPIVLIHGWQGDHRYMAADIEPVLAHEPGWQRIYVDLPRTRTNSGTVLAQGPGAGRLRPG
jgi:pimeloyl-ACP methyl ester carboxylesterase